MMYYDRSLPDALFKMLRDDGFLSWMWPLANSEFGRSSLAHVEFRKIQGGEGRLGSVQFYVGRTSALRVIRIDRKRFILETNERCAALSPDLFGAKFATAQLDDMGEAMEAHVRAVAAEARESFLSGEVAVHVGLLTRYGLNRAPDDGFLPVDTEVTVGSGDDGERRRMHAELETRFGAVHTKLDCLGILSDGDVALVEVKASDDPGDLATACLQAASHRYRFQKLIDQKQAVWAEYDLSTDVNRHAGQKAALGLVAKGGPRVCAGADLVPVVAVPAAEHSGWAESWRGATQAVRGTHAKDLQGLRFWRLSASGEIEDEVVA